MSVMISCTCFACSEILRHFCSKGESKTKAAPNLTAIFDHFNRVSCLCVWHDLGDITIATCTVSYVCAGLAQPVRQVQYWLYHFLSPYK